MLNMEPTNQMIYSVLTEVNRKLSYHSAIKRTVPDTPLTVSDVKTILGLTAKTVRLKLHRKQNPLPMVKVLGKYQITRDAFAEWLQLENINPEALGR